MRGFKDLFKITKNEYLEVIKIGNSKFIFEKDTNILKIKALINYAKVKNYIVLYLENVNDIYMINEEIFNLSNGFIIFYK